MNVILEFLTDMIVLSLLLTVMRVVDILIKEFIGNEGK